MQNKPLIIILNYLATEVTINCLDSLSRCAAITEGKFKVVVWENGSGAAAVARLSQAIRCNQWQTWVELRVSERNLGFTGGNNRVIQQELDKGPLPEYIWLLNSDTLVTEQSLLSLLAFMEQHPRAGIAGSRLLTEAGEHQCSPFRFPGIASEFEQGLKLGVVSKWLSRWTVSMPPPDSETPVDWVSGASMMLRREMLHEIGLLDEDYFTYFEDLDLCQRAHHAGWQVWYVPQSQVIHLEGASSGIGHQIVKRRPAFWFQARRRYFLKHQGWLRTASIDVVFIVSFALWRLRRRIQGKPDRDPPHLLGDFIRHSVYFQGLNLPKVRV